MPELDSFLDAVARLPQLPPAQRALEALDLRHTADVVLSQVQRAAIVEATTAQPAERVAEQLGMSTAEITSAVDRYTAARRRA